MRPHTLRRRSCLLAIPFALAAAATAHAQGDWPLGADDPIQYPVTDASGTIIGQTVISRKEHQARRDHLFAQMELIDGRGQALPHQRGWTLLATAADTTDEVQYRAPDGSIKTISRVEHESRVADLKQLIDDLNSNRKVLITEMGNPIPVPYERLQDFAKWLEKKGGLTALEIPG